MQDNGRREQLRQIYQREDTGEKTFIPAKPRSNPNERDRFFRVCAYCRVSTDNDEQLSSFELQQAHYRQLVQEHPNWELKHIFADQGISGTSFKNRDQFNAMIEACKKGEYDLILTKSVSRFARNLVDCISLIRMLKGLTPPVGVFFETDNLYTLGENTEFMLSFLATFAQEESVKKSESMNWSLQQRFKDGKLLTPAPLGYDREKDAAGHYVKYAPLLLNESEARIVRFIYDAYLAGWSQEGIAELLKDIGCQYVILGHSERRTNHFETSELVNVKAQAAYSNGLKVIICVGETLMEREAGQALDVCQKQVLDSVPESASWQNTVIAYEPVWAIGTGKVATPADVAEMHAAIRKTLAKKLGKANANRMRILYGGSVKPSNAKELLSLEDVDGALIGGASLKVEDFLGIAKNSGAI